MFTIIPPKLSTKNLIINLLYNESHQSITSLRNCLKKQFSHPISYQGLLKSLNLLENDGIIINENKKYSLNPQWVQDINSKFQLFSQSEVTHYSKEIQSLTFTSVKDAVNFILINTESQAFGKSKNKEFYIHMRNIFFCTFSLEHITIIKKILKEYSCKFIVDNSSLFNQVNGNYYKKLGAQVYLNAPSTTPHLTFLIGDVIVYIICPKLGNYLDEIFDPSQIIDMGTVLDAYEAMHRKDRFELKMKFETDPDIVKSLKKNLDLLAKNSELL